MATESQPKITLYWLNKSRSQRILWLLEELKVPYEVKTFKRDKDLRAAPELKEVHPLGKAPVLTIEPPGLPRVVLAESGFITEYLIEHFGPHLAPERWLAGKEKVPGGETQAWLRYRYYMHFVEGSFMPPLVTLVIAGIMRKARVPFFIKPIVGIIAGKIEGFARSEITMMLDMVEDDLKNAPEGGPWLCGKQLSGVDILVDFPLEAGQAQTGLSKEKYPKLFAYVEAMKEQDGYKRAVQKIIEIDGSYDGQVRETSTRPTPKL